jgi:glycosyltransferase involved in cell wall biosynthesis
VAESPSDPWRRSSSDRPRVLVFNFFSGIKERGIPLYARELKVCLDRLGFVAFELTCPRWLRRLPSPLLNVLFVGFEQIVAPLVARARRCRLTIYPYNTVAVVDSWRQRAVLVVHDLIPNDRRASGLATRYIRWTQRLHCARQQPICAVSDHTLKILQRLNPYAGCPLFCWTNPFYAFEEAARRAAGPVAGHRECRVLLASGTGANKNFAGALALFAAAAHVHDVHLRVVGFGNDAHLARRRIRALPESLSARITVLGMLTIDELAVEYRDVDLVWVHSLKEGYGRPVVEARLSGRPALVSNIGAFRQLVRLGGVYLYTPETFAATLSSLVAGGPKPRPAISAEPLHRRLESVVEEVMARFPSTGRAA